MAHGKCYPKPGDLIEVDRTYYRHWALYLGNGYVINVTPVDEGAPSLSVSAKSMFTGKAKVKKQLLKEVVGNDDWEVNNKYDRSYTPLPVAVIIRRAKSYIDKEVNYDVLTNNCEHFVTMLRYGKGVSHQVRDAVVATTVGAVGTIGVVAIAAAVWKGLSGEKSEKEKGYY